MSIDKSYLELALENIYDGQSNDDIVSLINEALKQASINTNEVEVSSDEIVTIPISSNPMTSFIAMIENLFSFNSNKQGKEFAKDYLKEMLEYAASQQVDNSVIDDLNAFLKMFE